METDKIIQENELNCSVEDFETYYDNVEVEIPIITSNKYTFDEKYNNVTIQNPANGKYYYTLSIDDKVYLQNHQPYVSGFVALKDDNVDEVIANHKAQITEEFINSNKLTQTILHFK